MKENQPVEILSKELLSSFWAKLYKITLNYFNKNLGHWQKLEREVYDRGNGACVLLYNPERKNILLVKQFRIPTYINGNPTGFLLEVCAGLIENESEETTIKREILEETGYQVKKVEKVYEAYMTPGADTEKLHFFYAEYYDEDKVHSGGGLQSENEDIEVVEIPLKEAYEKLKNNNILDAKTLILVQYAMIKGLD